MSSVPGTATQLVALLGHPVTHSISPALHNAAFAATGVDAVYVALDVAPERIDDAVAGVEALGLLGANVTLPHKRAVFLRVPRRGAAADATGAANTIYRDGEGLAADNTDVAGLRAEFDAIGVTGGDAVLLFGAGGAARAAAVALGERGARLEVVARRPDAAAEIRALAATAGAVTQDVTDPRLVINATTLGLHGEVLPERFMDLGAGQAALDLVYGPVDTPFVAAARANGAQARDGRGMLVAQAAAAFQLWTGRPGPLDVMTAAASAALAQKD